MPNNKDLVGKRGWFKGTGEEGDVILSSRVRLARNLTDYPFPNSLGSEQEAKVQGEIISAFNRLPIGDKFTILYLRDLSPVDRRILLERNIITHDFSLAKDKAVILSKDETISLMINEEDHIRLACIIEGMSLDRAFEKLDRIDTLLEEHIHFAISLEWGYLNSSLTDIGTGMRTSIMIHLPALVMTSLIEKALKAVTQVGLSVKGFFGEGINSLGDIYQISNQVSLGLSEYAIIKSLASVVTPLINYERKTRDELLNKRRAEIEDKVFRAFGILSSCRRISSREAIELLSNLRLGISLGIIDNVPLGTVNTLFFHCQKSHIQKLLQGLDEPINSPADTRNIDFLRARIIRESLLDEENVGGRKCLKD
ncbi:MAG TPA: protein arginine kinase [Spirochaetia bacterium]|nr:protein arginine kinase [Spirochaetia bacterium]